MRNTFKNDANRIIKELALLFDLITERPAVFFAGAGRSGLLLRCAAMRFMHLGLNAHIVGDTLTPPLNNGDLLLIASGSGETASLVSMARKARDQGAAVALVTTNPSSTLAAVADVLAVLPAPTPKAPARDNVVESSQPMGSLFEQGMFLLFETVTMELMRQRNLSSTDMFRRHANLE